MVLETELNPTNLWMAHGIIAKERAMKDLYDAWGK